MDDSAITDAEAKLKDKAKLNDEETKTVPKNINEKKATCKTQNFYILHVY